MEKKVNQSGVLRKRGRPAGKNRAPLSQNERRARNAQYERERRVEMTDAFSDLAAAAGCMNSISNADLLATVITQFQQASRVKHSSDLDSLRRCNKNLLAQIETLEARLAESDGGSSGFVKQEEAMVDDISRPVKRKRDDYAHHVEHNGYSHVPECSPPEYKYTPPVYSAEPKYFPDPSPSSIYLPEQKFIPDSKYSPQSILQDHEHISPEPECSSKQECKPLEPQYSIYSAKPQYCLPVPRVSPLSDSSDHLPADTDVVDYSSYNFAGTQIPTPEYQITSEFSEYIVPEQQYSLGYCEYQPSPQCFSGPSSPEEYSPSPYMPAYPEMHYGATINQQPAFEVPVQPSMGSVGVLQMPGAAILPGFDEAEQDSRREHFVSTEDLISAYL